jgi:HD-like signal output (HDOD) protein
MRGLCISDVVQLGKGRSGRDEKLESCVRHIFETEGVPAFCEHVRDVMTRTFNLESSSIELAHVILKDLGLTSQVLRIANSALYNRSGRAIMSVAHAITLLGWDTVRNMLSTIRYIEHFATGSPGVHELMLLSVLNAVHSRDVAAAAGYPRPEEAYICGLFRNLGEVLVACHYPHEYSLIVVAMETEKIPARAACMRYLDFSWDDVGRFVSEAWNMPSKVSLCMRGWRAQAESSLDRSLASITDYAHDLTHALYRKGDGIESVHLRYVSDPDGANTLVSLRDLTRIVETAANETQETFSELGIPRERLLLAQQASRAKQILESTPVFTAAALKGLDHAIETARQKLDRNDFELTVLIASLLNAICSAGFDCAVFGLLNEDHTAVRGRLAGGLQTDEMLSHFHFPVDRAEGPIRAALVNKTDVLVDRARDDRYDRSSLVMTLDPVAFALFPVVTDGRAVACLYAHRGSPSPGLNLARAPLGRVRDVIGEAIRKKAPQPAARATV